MSYQLTDHLGNVRAVVTKNGSSVTMSSYADYYPFGEQLPNRNSMSGYRYAFQGQELDPETGMEAFQLRLWDGRIGRWLTTDPYGQYASPYLGMGNNPICGFDKDGGWVINAIAAVVGGVVSGGISYYNQGGFSGKKVNWTRVLVATGSGALAGATLNLGAAVSINMSADVGDQLLSNGGDFNKVNLTQTAFSGVTTYIGGKAGGALLSKNVMPSVRTLIDKVHTGKAIIYGIEVVGHSLSLSKINTQALNLATGFSEAIGGGLSFGGSKLMPQFNQDYIKEWSKQAYNNTNNFFQNSFRNMMNYFHTFKDKYKIIVEPLIEIPTKKE